jgi:8-oxo-dGTP pyrophosphatase MutT (NUDIX family)
MRLMKAMRRSSGRDVPTHAGGVVYRFRAGTPEFLLVTARRQPKEWVLPKGHIEEGESAEETAVREVEEEAGVLATVERALGELVVEVRGEEQRIRYFLMQFIGNGRAEESRGVSWVSVRAAADKLAWKNVRALVRRAANVVSANGKG